MEKKGKEFKIFEWNSLCLCASVVNSLVFADGLWDALRRKSPGTRIRENISPSTSNFHGLSLIIQCELSRLEVDLILSRPPVRNGSRTIAGGEVVSADRCCASGVPLIRAAAVRPTEELTPMRGLPIRPIGATAIALGFILLFALTAWAHHYRLESATPPAPFLRDGRVDVEIEPTGVVPLGEGRRVLVADGKAGSLHVVDLATGTLVGEPLGSPKFPRTTKDRTELGGHGPRLRGELLPDRLAQRQERRGAGGQQRGGPVPPPG